MQRRRRNKQRPRQEGEETDNNVRSSGGEKSISEASKWPSGNFPRYYAIRRDVREGFSTNANEDDCPKDKRVRSILRWLGDGDSGTHQSRCERMLDIGCNCGLVTLELAKRMRQRPTIVVGVDVDDSLIRQAQRLARQNGFQKPGTVEQQKRQDRLAGSFGAGNRGNSLAQPRKRLRLDDEESSIGTAGFYTSEWVFADVEPCIKDNRHVAEAVRFHDRKGYDLITLLSVTKWVHLAYADDGLRRLFARVADVLRPGGILILEPQPWKSYTTLHKVTDPDSQERANWNAMRVMPDDFPFILSVELGLQGPVYIEERGKNGFLRDLQIYTQPPLDQLSSSQRERRAVLLARQKVHNPLLPAHLDHIHWVQRDRKACV